MINNRQAGRRRGRGGNNNGPRPNGGGGQRDSGNRIDSRARGNANQLYEKYKNLAADSQRQGDRVTTEYYLQFADHYFRVLSESRARFDEQNQQRPRRDDGYEAQPFTGSFDTGFDGQDDEYADEGEPIRAGEQAFTEDRGERPPVRNDRNGAGNGQQPRRDDRPRDDRPREDRSREDRPREERPRAEARRDDNGDRAPRDHVRSDQMGRDQIVRDQAPRDEESRRDDGESFTRRPRRVRDEGAPTIAEAAPTPSAPEIVEATGEGDAPRRRGRPRRERPAEDALATFDATVLPPSLGTASVAADAPASAEEKPRRRRVRAPTADAPATE